MESPQSKKTSLPSIIIVVFVIALGFGGYSYATLRTESQNTKLALETKVSELEGKIGQMELEKTSLNDALYAEQSKNEEFEEQIREISGTVGTLEKLSKTDPELLKKYSKVYFLNEHYQPSRLVALDSSYLFDPKKEQYLTSPVKTYLKKLIDEADDDGLDLKVLSAFRSFGTQANLKTNYTVTYGAGTANQFSAEQGYSEHQLGTTVDFTNPTIGAPLTGFETTEEYKWLQENAYKYGFVLSYPEGNTYYQFEPWHWRFVGIKLAKKLHTDNAFFYDLDQRDIDKYLVNIFD